MIKPNIKSDILKKYKVNETDFLGKGQEAEVYSYGVDEVIKLYDVSALEKQKSLKRFYESMRITNIHFQLPEIHQIIDEKSAVITIEKRIKGRNIQKDLGRYDEEKLISFFKNYLSVVLNLKDIKLQTKFDGYKLLEDYDLNTERPVDWFDFLKQSLIKKNEEIKTYIKRDVINYEIKLEKILIALSKEYKGEYALIHGDFYPSNLIVDENGDINGVIDFGLMTLYGDPVFDLALSWSLFDLYEEVGEKKLELYLNMMIDTIGVKNRKKIYLYALFYYIYSANFFSENCSDAHYQWSVRNLNNEKYWAEL